MQVIGIIWGLLNRFSSQRDGNKDEESREKRAVENQLQRSENIIAVFTQAAIMEKKAAAAKDQSDCANML